MSVVSIFDFFFLFLQCFCFQYFYFLFLQHISVFGSFLDFVAHFCICIFALVHVYS